MASRFWINGTGNWDGIDTTHWSASSGGSGGASAPTGADNVTFDGASGGGTVTMTASPTVNSITMGAFTGTLNANGFNPTMATFSVSGTGVRTLTMGSGTWTLTGNAAIIWDSTTLTNFTLVKGNPFVCNYAGATGTRTVQLGQVENKSPDFNFTAGTDIILFSGSAGSLDFTGFSGTVANSNFGIYGNLTLSATMTVTTGSPLTLQATAGSWTITSNTATLNKPLTISSQGGFATYTIADTLNLGTNSLTLSAGSLNLNGKTITATTFVVSGSGTRSLTTGAATINLTAAQSADVLTTLSGLSAFTYSGGSETWNLSAVNNTIVGFGGNTVGTVVVANTNTATTCTVRNMVAVALTLGAGANASFSTNYALSTAITVSGAFTATGVSTADRILIASDTVGTPRAISAGSVSVSNCDFRDISGTGAATWNMSGGAAVGDCGGNTMQALGTGAFTASTTQHWTNASSGNWSATGNWTSRVPLPQDDVVMDKAFGVSQTVTANTPRLGRSIDWTGATWTTALTFSQNAGDLSIFGSLTLISGLTYTSNSSNLIFRGRGSYTVSSKGVTINQPVILNAPTGTLTLGDNFTIPATAALSIANGTFTIVNGASNFVISAGNITFTGGAGSILTLGTATHLITGTGFVFSMAGNQVINPGTSTLKFTDTSNATMTFSGGSKSFNNIWFSRGASTGSITIANSNVFNDFKDDGTAAHSLLFTAGTTQHVTTFTVAGSSGNAITLNSTSTSTFALVKDGGGTITKDWLNIQHCVATPSRTWYASSNCVNNQGTATAGSGWSFTRYWVGGTGNWDASTLTNWSATSGGAGGASLPTSSDDVVFDANSSTANAAYTVTITATANCQDLTMGGPGGGNAVTWAGSSALNIFGIMNLSGGTAGITRTYTGTITFSAVSTGMTITCNSVVLASPVTFNGVGGGWTNQDTFNIGSASTLTLTAGALNTNGVTVTCGTCTITGSTVRSLTLGASTINCSTWTATNPGSLTFSGASSTIAMSGNTTFDGGTLTYGTVTLSGNTPTVTALNTFGNLTMTPASPAKTDTLTFTTDQVITGTFTVSDGATVTNRVLVKSSALGVTRIITAAAISTSNSDWQDITGTGAASWNMSSDTGGSGDCGGNTMKALGSSAFTTAATQHWLNTLGGSWSTAANWTSRVPLPQDNVVMDCAFGGGASQTVTIDMPRLGKSVDWTGATSVGGITLTTSVACSIFGSLTFVSGMFTQNGGQTVTLAGRGSFSYTSNGTLLDLPLTINAPGGTYTMGDNISLGTTRTLTVTLGTFDTNGHVLTTGLISLGTGANNINAVLNLNSATHILTGTGTVWTSTSTLPTSILNAGTSTIKIIDASSNAATVNNSKTLYNVWFSRGESTATNTISGSGIYHDIKDDGLSSHQITFTAGTITAVTTFTVTGTANKVITLASSSGGSKFTLLCSTGTITCDYMIIQDSLVGGGATWNSGSHSTFLTGNYFGTGFGWADAPSTVQGRYWVTGGNGNWSSATNWANSSGGTAGATVPVGEKVFFNASSGAGTSTIDASSSCGDFDCTGFTGTINGTAALSVLGKFKLVSGMGGFNYTGAITFNGSGSSKTIDFSTFSYLGTGITLSGADTNNNLFSTNGYGDTWTLSSNLIGTQLAGTLQPTIGTFDANGFNVTFGLVSFSGTNARTVKMGSGTWTLIGSGTVWSLASSSACTIIPSTSTIKLTDPTSSSKLFAGGGKTYYNIWLTGTGTGAFQFSDSNTFNDIKCDTPPHTISFTPGTVTTFSTFTVAGTPGNLMTIGSVTNNSQHFLHPIGGSFSTDYLIVSDSNVIGVGYAGTHSLLTAGSGIQGNTTNWFLAAPSTAVSGQVTLSGVGVSGAIVRLILSATNTEIAVTTTDGSGNYTFYADSSKLYHVAVEYTSGGTKYNAKSLWAIVPI